MAGETVTPNIGLQVPGFDQANWQVPINYDLNLLDQIFGGLVTVPSLSVVELTVENFVIANLIALLDSSFVAETPAGTAPTTTYTCSHIPGLVIGAYKNGLFQVPGTDYTVAGNQIVFAAATISGDKVYVTYFH